MEGSVSINLVTGNGLQPYMPVDISEIDAARILFRENTDRCRFRVGVPEYLAVFVRAHDSSERRADGTFPNVVDPTAALLTIVEEYRQRPVFGSLA